MNCHAPALAAWLAERGVMSKETRWTRVRAGRSNRVWRLDSPVGAPLICKLGLPDHATPIFPNDPAAEAAGLDHLAQTGLAPAPVAAIASPWGAVLIMEALAVTGPATPAAVGGALARLHRVPVLPGARRLVLDGAVLLAEAEAMLAAAPPVLRAAISAIPPDTPAPETGSIRLLHGDPAPDNVLATAAGIRFVDWQCPATGDPVFDLACFAAPSMRLAAGVDPLSDHELDDLLRGYGDGAIAARFRRWRACLSYRFAAHAAWRAGHGHPDYAAGARAEVYLLEHLSR
ncbi:aminoglycoside phosphotransferase family protein [Palleronia pelagia]|uniref:Phosphotransferase enzyme family protein n=1 Tax=Palleronia pelagia TaxID=387096 RepID=A0A1H8L6R7_9RHOB|nr:aminoglycoside phosphotransferase family protein [Palleronia pelagia]SEO00803.1 Phosphotransferase enzyme family protein [Palleronia pelagia]